MNLINKLIFLAKRLPNPELSQILEWFANVGVILVPDKMFGYKLQPIIGEHHWQSKDEWEQEKQYLAPHREELINLLRSL